MPSNDTIAALKKKCLLAKKKNLSFYYFAKAENGEPALLIGKAAAVRAEQKALAKTHRTKPVAQGIVKKADAGQGLTFELYKGKTAALKKALKSTFGGVPLLKAAGVETHAKKVSLKDKLSGGLKGGSKAFKRRAGKLNDAFAAAGKLLAVLAQSGVAATGPEGQLEDLREALDAADALAETDPKDAYTALAPIKADVQKLTAALKRLQADLDTHRAAATADVSAAQEALDAAEKALGEMKAVGYDGDEEGAEITEAKQALVAARKQIQADPLTASATAAALTTRLSTLAAAIDKKKGQSRASLVDTIEATVKAGERVYERRLTKVEAAIALAKGTERYLRVLKILSSDDARAIKALDEGLRIATKSAEDSYVDGYSQLARVKSEVGAVHARLTEKLARYNDALATLGALGDRLGAAQQRLAAITSGGGSVDGAAEALRGLYGALADAEVLATSDPRKAAAAARSLSADTDRLDQRLDRAVSGGSPKGKAFWARARAVRQTIADIAADDERLRAMISESSGPNKAAIADLRMLVTQSESLSTDSIPDATTVLKRARSDARKLQAAIQKEVSAHPKQTKAFRAQADRLFASVTRAEHTLNTIGDARDLTEEKQQAALLRKTYSSLNGPKRHPGRKARALAAPVKEARQLCERLDRILAEEAVAIRSKATDTEAPEAPEAPSQAARNIALLQVQLQAAQVAKAAQAKKGILSSDQDKIFTDLQERLDALPGQLASDPLDALQEIAEAGTQVNKLRALLEARGRGVERIDDLTSGLSLDKLRSSKPLWERFLAFALEEWSMENLILWQGLLEGRYRSPRAKRTVYTTFLATDAPSEINTDRAKIKACFPAGLPTDQQMEDWGLWAAVDYSEIVRDLGVNIADTFSRFRYTISEPATEDLKRSHLRDCEKVIAKWEKRLA